MKTKLYYCILIGLIIICFWRCEKLDANYKQFIEGGEIDYVERADSLKVAGGDQRAELSWLIFSDPRVSNYKIYWDNRQGSLSGSFNRTDRTDTVSVIVDSLEEGIHDFEVVMSDEDGNSSVVVSTSGRVYGEFYKQSKLNRAVKEFNKVEGLDHALEIEWEDPDSELLFFELTYDNINGDRKMYIAYPENERDTLKNITFGTTIDMRSAYIPDSTAIDTFYTESEELKPEIDTIELDKSLWENAALADDSYETKYSLDRAWDGDQEDVGQYFRLDDFHDSMPIWFTIDLGEKRFLTKMLVNHWQSGNWRYGNDSPKKIEIYGSNVKSTDWDDWTLLGEFESEKPSGLPYGELSDEDIAQNLAGEEYELNETNEAYQYFRFKTLEVWDGTQGLMLAELTLWGY